MAKEKDDILSHIGIDVDNENIAIDTGKTKKFFGDIHKKLKDTAKSIGENIKEGTADASQNVGIKLDDEHIEADLHETKSYIEEIGEKIEHFLAQLEHSTNKLSKK